MSEKKGNFYESISSIWQNGVIETLKQYVSIPNQSPLFDSNYLTNGYQEAAVDLLVNWVKTQNVNGLEMKVVSEPNRTPVIFITIESSPLAKRQDNILLYGHLDKQPPMTEAWESGLGPYKPVIRDGKLYGRGSSDDGYSIFAAISAIKTLQLHHKPHARCVVLIEACEESGSRDLPFYIENLASFIQTPSLIICLDSGCGNYNQMWITTSLRGLIVGTLTVSTISEAVHSGSSSGIVPSSERVIRQLLDRIEDSKNGEMIQDLYVQIPQKHQDYAQATAATLGDVVYSEFPFLQNVKPTNENLTELCLNRTWRPTLCITGQAGLPSLDQASNVTRTHTSLKLSIRLPPSLEPLPAVAALKRSLESNPPYGARVTFAEEKASQGWLAPDMVEWLERSVNKSSKEYYGEEARFMGEGGSIPFMGMLGRRFPQVQFVITGVLGPKSNAHGPNEFLDLEYAQKLSCCVASIISDHFQACCT